MIPSSAKLYFSKVLLLLVVTSSTLYGQSGVISTNRATKARVTFSESSVLTGIGNGKFIDGYVKKNGNTKFTFPVGDNGIYRPFAAGADGTMGAYYRESAVGITISGEGPFSNKYNEVSLGKVSNYEFWDIDGTNATRLTLTWNASSDVAATTGGVFSKLTIAGWNPATLQWEKIISTVDATALTGGTSSFSSGSITTNSALIPNSYSIYALAATSSGALPVTLISFTASLDDSKYVNLKWSTTFESNSSIFNIEQSSDAKTWNLKGTVEAQGESSATTFYDYQDKEPNNGTNFYRLKMIDKDGSFSFSRIEKVNLESEIRAAFYPNPVSDRLYLQTEDISQIKEISIYNIMGREVYRSKSLSKNGIDMKGNKAGIYIATVLLSNGTTHTQKIVINN